LFGKSGWDSEGMEKAKDIGTTRNGSNVFDGCLSIEKKDVEKIEKSQLIFKHVVNCESPKVKATANTNGRFT
jgi:hypothetical protein